MRWLWLVASVVALDQLSKWAVVERLVYGIPNPVMPGLNLLLVHNTGMAFSILHDAGGWQRWTFAVVAIVISGGILWWLVRYSGDKFLLALALALIAGGAIGNVIDRLALGYVIDFIDVYWRDWHWPAFNAADSAITLGAIVLIVDALREMRDEAA